MPTNDRDIAALIHLARRLREETHGCKKWDERGVEVKVAEFKGMNLAIVVEQILRHATDPEAETPGALHRKFSPPMPSEKPKGPAEPPRKTETCRAHPAQRAESCPWCVHRVKAWDEDDDQPATRFDDPRKAAREQVRGRRETEEEMA